MKKLLLLLLCVPLIFSFVENVKNVNKEKKEIKNDLTRNNVKGKVKKIKGTVFEVEEALGGPQKGNIKQNINIQFNEDGNKTEETSYNSDGELQSKYKYQYDKDGNITERTSYNLDGELSYKIQYHYDEYGNDIEKISYNADGIRVGKIKKYHYEYDKLDNWIVLTEYSVDKLLLIIEREIEYYQ